MENGNTEGAHWGPAEMIDTNGRKTFQVEQVEEVEEVEEVKVVKSTSRESTTRLPDRFGRASSFYFPLT
jgi:hypothetical protein